MPLYFFDVVNGTRLIDPDGTSCADDHDAIRLAKVFALKAAMIPSSMCPVHTLQSLTRWVTKSVVSQ